MGQTINIHKRLRTHIFKGLDGSFPLEIDSKVINSKDLNFDIDILEIDSLYNTSKKTRLYLEQQKQNAMCREYPNALVVGK